MLKLGLARQPKSSAQLAKKKAWGITTSYKTWFQSFMLYLGFSVLHRSVNRNWKINSGNFVKTPFYHSSGHRWCKKKWKRLSSWTKHNKIHHSPCIKSEIVALKNSSRLTLCFTLSCMLWGWFFKQTNQKSIEPFSRKKGFCKTL